MLACYRFLVGALQVGLAQMLKGGVIMVRRLSRPVVCEPRVDDLSDPFWGGERCVWAVLQFGAVSSGVFCAAGPDPSWGCW